MPVASDQSHQVRGMWQSCLSSAFRTMLACAIVGCATIYGPASFTHQVAFPAFSLVTVLLIVTDATLGDTIRGCWFALYATIQGVGPAILSLWLIGPARFSTSTTALAVAISAFVVALPNATHVIAKRIALGQIVIVYVIAFINGVHTEAVMHPVHVAASTAIGALASVLAFLLPYPWLACYEVKKKSKLYAENASQRLKLFVMAFCAADNTSALSLISQAKFLSVKGTKLLQSIKKKQESMQWERLFKASKPFYITSGYGMQDLEIPIRGMEIALTSDPSFPVTMLDEKLKDGLDEHVGLIIKQVKSRMLFDSTTAPESKAENATEFLQTLLAIPLTQKSLPSLFFLFCLKLFCRESMDNTPTPAQECSVLKDEGSNDSCKKEQNFFKVIWHRWAMKPSRKRLMPAFKCSLSLGLAVLFGLIYSKENGYWSGLPLALSLVPAREATFKVANVKAQGTVLGSVYGVLGCFAFERFFQMKLLSLLPWFIFTNFLKRSRMYGLAGGVSADIGAVLILARKNFGVPSEFAIARIVETFIGLSSTIIVEIVLQPTRASTLAKIQLSKSLSTLHECVTSISLCANKSILQEHQKRLKIHVNELGKLIGEAEVEPNFRILPFHSASYGKLMVSLSKMVDLLLFGTHAMAFVEHESKILEASWKEIVDKLDDGLNHFKETIASSIKCCQEVCLIKSLTELEKELEKNNISSDLELGKSPSPKVSLVSNLDEDEMEKMINSYLQHSQEIIDKIHPVEAEKEQKSQMVLSLSAFGFCMSSMVKETAEIERGIREIIQWENPSSHVNLCDISCKMHALDN